jgi:hypothetical protein
MQSGPSIQSDAQFGNSIAGGLSQIVGTESTETQDNNLHFQIQTLLSISVFHRRRGRLGFREHC